MFRRLLQAAACAFTATALLAAAASAQTKINIGYTAVTDFASAFVAQEQGFFKKHGLDAEFTLITLNSNIPAAVLSNSVQIGGPTPSVHLQAVDGGLDLVIIAGGSVTSKTITSVGVVARPDSSIAKPEDFVGKKIGVPGLGAFLHVLFRQWLIEKGVDFKKVTFVEVSFPQMNDVLKSGQIDGVVTADPFMARIIAAGTGKHIVNYLADLPEGIPAIYYTVTREWAQKNPAAVKGFKEAIAEGAAFVKANPDKAREDLGKYIKLPPEVLKTIQLSVPDPVVTEAQLKYWVDAMKKQEMLKAEPKIADLIVK